MPQEHQEYIQQKVNPLLENLVTQLLLERPGNLSSFMFKWLSDHAKSPAAAALTEGVKEVSKLKTELEQLQKEVVQLEENLGEKMIRRTNKDKQEEEEAEDDDEDEDEDDCPDELPPLPDYLTRGPRASVSAEAYGQWNEAQAFEPPVHPKSEEQKGRILLVLQDSFMFASLTPKEKDVVADAMQEKIFEAGDRIIEQGDDGEAMFVVEEGQVSCYKRLPEGDHKLVKQCRAGDAFGELALLYNCPRAASVKSRERSVLWQLDRDTFSHIVRGSASKRRDRYEDFLKKVPVLKTMESYELSLLCDALQTMDVSKGSTIVSQGDTGDNFFILEEGECTALKVYAPGTPAQEVMQYRSGDYFGELSLLSNEPRAATVVASTDCRLVTLSRKTFKSLLGTLEDILKRHASQYK